MNATITTDTTQNCYVDLNPHTSGMPRPPYRITDAPFTWDIWAAPSAPPEPPDNNGSSVCVASGDLEAMLRRVIREELGKLRIMQSNE